MDILTQEQFKVLAELTSTPSISIYLPTHRAGRDTEQDSIRFKNLVRGAEKRLREIGKSPREIEKLLKPVQLLIDDALFWSHQYDGLAVFLSDDGFSKYRLPLTVEEQLVIADTYYIKPVLPLFTENGHYFILALSQDVVRLFEATRYSVGQIDLPEGTPKSIDEVVDLDNQQKQLQVRTATSSGSMGGSIYHGQGPGDEEQKALIEKYLNLVDTGLKEIFREEHAPLVLAGVDYLLPIYRSVSEYKNIMQAGITGSPEKFRPEELQEKTWPIVEAFFQKEVNEAIGQYEQLQDTDKTSDNVPLVVEAANHSRMDKLFLSVQGVVWGSVNPDSGKVSIGSKGQDSQHNLALLDFAALRTLQNGGAVYALDQADMPTGSPVAAVFRY